MFIKKGRQQTLNKEIKLKGIALHTGEEAEITIKSAASDRGIVLFRADLESKELIKARPESVVNLKRNTSIGSRENKKANISTIEHLMAALWGAGIDNAEIAVSGPEIPVIDGSAYPYYRKIKEVGIKKQEQKRSYYVVEKTLSVRDNSASISISPYTGFKISYTLDYDHPVVGKSFFEFDVSKDDFAAEIAQARTFGFAEEIEKLHQQGLALGGSLDNAVLIDKEGTVNPLRFENEFVRHKILDVIGDMALNGRIMGHIKAVKSGHKLHVELAKKIRENMIEEEN
ncbi:UDP-3-0-acyl N-acetylglucosamine deacetylase [Halanaerobium hydrogeniformans]|uniref:UDP-3-O-acyl-N-acetylglucosamine deacetylase n=1 Tax=Halanaerobium hydrogeniformans TaxID=656519 RepID=E4RP69_HALHG|nr:UDP-3-0-acyl N-acetylglucosamine deacetylase [Halanaerobium hydrogeniformans]